MKELLVALTLAIGLVSCGVDTSAEKTEEDTSLTSSFVSGSASTITESDDEEYATCGSVYICTGPKATKYHSSSHCRGLNKCSESIKAISESEATKKGYTPCRICYQRGRHKI